MHHPTRNRILPTAVLTVLLVLCASAPASALWLGQYFNTVVGTVWTYENVDQPGFYRTESAFEFVVYEGDFAARIGPDITDHFVAHNSGRVITVYAETDDGVLVDFPTNMVLGEFDDGSMLGFCPFGGECDSSLVRVWTEIDPGLRTVYGLDPGVTDLVMIASYDSDYDKNLHNTVLESNLPGGVLPPTGAVTGVEWFQWKTGLYAELDVDAQSGGFEEYWVLVDFVTAAVDDLPSPVARLDQNVPNPFNPLTTIPVSLGADVPVRLTVHDPRGRLVTVLADGWRPGVGIHGVDWDGRDAAGRPAPGGVYLYRLTAAGATTVRSLVLVR